MWKSDDFVFHPLFQQSFILLDATSKRSENWIWFFALSVIRLICLPERRLLLSSWLGFFIILYYNYQWSRLFLGNGFEIGPRRFGRLGRGILLIDSFVLLAASISLEKEGNVRYFK